MTEDKRKTQLLKLFSTMSGKTKIVEPMKNIHGTLRDSDAIEREVTLVMREILEQEIFKTTLSARNLATLYCDYQKGMNDTKIARELGDGSLAKTVARARVKLKLFRDFDFNMPFDREKFENLLKMNKTMVEIGAELGVSGSTVRQYRHVIDQMNDPTIDPYLERIKYILDDKDLSMQLTKSVTQDSFGESIDITEAEIIEGL